MNHILSTPVDALKRLQDETATELEPVKVVLRHDGTDRTNRTDGGEAAGRTGWGNDAYAVAEIMGIFKNSRSNRIDMTDRTNTD